VFTSSCDLINYMAIPWRFDSNKRITQPVDIIFADWNNPWPGSDNNERTWTVL